jgi:hypothetical protein
MSSGCCDKEITEPTRPVVHGWKATQLGSITVKGSFILQKGETTDNGQIGIKLVDVYPAKCRLFNVSELPYAKIQFYKVSDKATICEGLFTLGSHSLDLPHLCGDKLEWNVIYIQDVNFKEGWAAFDIK